MAQPLPPEISLDKIGRFTFAQPKQGYRFSMDAVLLAAFAGPVRGPAADLGAGCGVIGVLAHGLGSAGPFTAVELDPLAAACCRENFQRAAVPGQVLEHDLTRPHAQLPPASFQSLLCNPPFGKKGGGRVSPNPARATARHELALATPRLLDAVQRLLAPRGRFFMCWPPSRLVEVFVGLSARGLAPKRLRLVHGREGKPARIALLEAVKGGGEELAVPPPLFVYGPGQSYSREAAEIYDCFA